MKYYIPIAFLFVNISCAIYNPNPVHTTGIYSGIYRKLIEAADQQDTIKMQKIVAAHHLNLDYAEPANGLSLLNWCIINEKEKSFETLLKLGANPNWEDTIGTFPPPITEAANSYDTSLYLELALKYNGGVNLLSRKPTSIVEPTPLIAAILSYRIDNVKLLIENGADVNLTKDSMYSPLAEALIQKRMEIVMLLLNNGADYDNLNFWTLKIATDKNGQDIHNNHGSPIAIRDKELRILDFLRDTEFPLNSDRYITKMEVVAFLKTKGLDYRSYPIPDDVKKRHKDDTAYLSKY